MNILFIKHFFVGFIVSEIPRVSVFGYFPLLNKNIKYNFKITIIPIGIYTYYI